eukprot:jgi/Mesvir1/17749/Mv12100-RA.1
MVNLRVESAAESDREVQQMLTHADASGFEIATSADIPLEDGEEDHPPLVYVPKEDGWRKMLAYVGPGFLVAIAYVDPGNFESDLRAGARYKYQLLWVLLWSSVGGLILQSLAANLGIVTGRHLAQHCRSEYPPRVNFALWMVAEVAIIASDVPEVIGTAFALQMLFGLPLWLGVVLTGADTMLLLAVQRYGVRRIELLISLLVMLMAGCFFVELGHSAPDISEAIQGISVPHIADTGSALLGISIIGAVIMPHNLYLHSALVLSRRTRRTREGLRGACRYNSIECGVALLVALLINLAVTLVAASICGSEGLPAEEAAKCADLSLHNTPFLLKNTLGRASEKLFGVALLASGQSSTLTGTFAGQYVMSGFLDLRVKPWLRLLVTRSAAILPSLAICLAAGNEGGGQLIILASTVLSFQLPFALLPLLKFVGSKGKMGPLRIGDKLLHLSYGITAIVISANVFLLSSTLFDAWQQTRGMGALPLVAVTALALAFAGVYLGSLFYLAVRPDQAVTFVGLAADEEDEDVGGGRELLATKDLGVDSVEKADSPLIASRERHGGRL